ncbi:MAG: hypothetical protein LLG13_01245 [Bacteroidales bacterium]|nr:hypothetical protein [Bacteroidales bacterium]
MLEKKQTIQKTPDITKLQEVVINNRTKIYIPVGADPEEAKRRYQTRLDEQRRALITPKKTTLV